MLDKNDLQQIKGIVDQAIDAKVPKIVDKSLEGFYTKYIKPSFDETFSRLDKVEIDVSTLKDDVRRLPDKDYLDRKLFDLKGELNENIQKVEKKVNYHTKVLRKNDLLDDHDLNELKKFDTFRVMPEPLAV